jgi:hypothetical protein
MFPIKTTQSYDLFVANEQILKIKYWLVSCGKCLILLLQKRNKCE